MVAQGFGGVAEFSIRFQPFQLYPDLPTSDGDGVDKGNFFKALGEQRRPNDTAEMKRARVEGITQAWAADGLKLTSAFGWNGGRFGNSFNSQRLIWLARQQGREDAMIEEVYKSNHELNESLADWSVLLRAAERAGVTGAPTLLQSDQGAAEVMARIDYHRRLGITAVPVLILDEQYLVANGAPERDFLAQAFSELIESGALPWGRIDVPPPEKAARAPLAGGTPPSRAFDPCRRSLSG